MRAEGPAFYALPPGGWRDGVTLLHLPYTAWHLSYFALGAALAPHLHGDRLLWGLAAFFLAVGIAAHALDELKGRPLGTHLSDHTLVGLAALSLGGACTIGVIGAATVSLSLVPLVAAGVLLVLAYNLELFGGRLHGDFWFAAAWGAFPALTGYVANAAAISVPGALIAGGCFGMSAAQRRLSTPARDLRRRTASVRGRQEMTDGQHRVLTSASLAEPLEGALSAMSLAMVLIAAALVAARL